MTYYELESRLLFFRRSMRLIINPILPTRILLISHSAGSQEPEWVNPMDYWDDDALKNSSRQEHTAIILGRDLPEKLVKHILERAMQNG